MQGITLVPTGLVPSSHNKLPICRYYSPIYAVQGLLMSFCQLCFSAQMLYDATVLRSHFRNAVTTIMPTVSVYEPRLQTTHSPPTGRLAWWMLNPVHLDELMCLYEIPLNSQPQRIHERWSSLSCKTYGRPRSSTSALSRPARYIENHSSDRRLHCSCSTQAPTVPVTTPRSKCSCNSCASAASQRLPQGTYHCLF